MPAARRTYGLRSRYQQPQQDPPRRDQLAEQPQFDRVFREEGEVLNAASRRRIACSRKLFTLRVRMGGQFKRFRGRRVWLGGQVRYIDWCRTDEMSYQKLNKLCAHLGVSGATDYFYKKPNCSLDDGLVWVKDIAGIREMTDWVPAYHEIELYVVHPTREEVVQRLWGEAYTRLRAMWPKAVVEEVTDEEASNITAAYELWRLNNEEPEEPVLCLPWYPMEDSHEDGVLLLTWQDERVEAGVDGGKNAGDDA